MMGPTSLFLRCWADAAQWSPSQRRNVPEVAADEDALLQAALRSDDGAACQQQIEQLLSRRTAGTPEFRALILRVMRRIDEAFQQVHPRSLRLAPTLAPRNALPVWLLQANEVRRSTGSYGVLADRYLIARGPLSRAQRGEHDTYADSLADRFAFLSVVPDVVVQDERRITVAMRIIDADAINGVPAGRREPGRESICAVPLAEIRSDLAMTERQQADTAFVAYGPSATLQPGARLVDAVDAAAKAIELDIAVAPEFVMPSGALQDAMSALQKLAAAPCRLLFAGSGNTVATENGQPWNEAVVVNGNGVPLWSQRKVWPASIDRQRASEFGLSAGFGNLFEDNAAGNSVEVVDIDSIGRCLVLVCQDFESSPMAPELIRRWQPDWIFVPILDRGMAAGGWFHRRAQALSGASRARFVAVSSVALPRAGTSGPLSCVMVACALDGDGVAPNRALAQKPAASGTSPGFAIVDFDSEPWEQSAVVVQPISHRKP